MDTNLPEASPRIRRRFHYLLSALVGQIILSPLLGSLGGLLFQDLLFLMVLLAALQGARQSSFFRPMMLLGLGCGLSVLCKYVTESSAAAVVSDVLGIAMVLLTTLGLIRALMRRSRVDLDTVFGGLCVYLLIGVFWFTLYSLAERLNPGSFSFTLHGTGLPRTEATRLLFFFSYVTLLTTGYGDVIPLSPVAQTLSIVEGVVGQFYSVFFMARLVGLYVAGKEADSRRGGAL